jgi:hypothetical protein
MSERPNGANQPDDPTAPVWAEPTAPIPSPPAPPGEAPPHVQQPADPQDVPAPPPMINPYAQQPGVQSSGQPTYQYGQPASQYGQQYPPYGQAAPSQRYPPYGQPSQQYPPYGQQPYPTGPPVEANTSGIVLTVVSGIIMLSTCFLIGIPSLVFGIMALTSNTTDPLGSRKHAKTGWIIFAVNLGVVVLLAIAAIALLVVNSTSRSNPNFSS